MGGDDQVPRRISESAVQVTEESVLDRSLAPTNEVEESTLVGRTACRRALRAFSAIQTAYQS